MSTAAVLLLIAIAADMLQVSDARPSHNGGHVAKSSRHRRELPDEDEEERIVAGGVSIVPWFVSLPGCGGSLISPQWVVTAAQCIHDERTQIGSIARMGNNYRNGRGNGRTCIVQRIVQHPDYNAVTFANDVALVQLDCIVEYTDTISAIALPTATDGIRDSDFTRVRVAGFGQQHETATTLSSQLHEVSLNTVNVDMCEKAINFSIDNSMMCAYAQGKGSCGGDCGGPVVVQYNNMRPVLYGIVSFSIGCARKGMPTVCHHLPSSVIWIHNIIDDDDISASSDEQSENHVKQRDERNEQKQPLLVCSAGVRCFGHTSTSLVDTLEQCSSQCANESTCNACTFQPAAAETSNENICFKYSTGYHCSRDGHNGWTSCGDM